VSRGGGYPHFSLVGGEMVFGVLLEGKGWK
jgi:hypothetical protein